MKKKLFLDARKIHFVGIGGIGVSALAGILNAQGKRISGSDKEASTITHSLAKTGVKIFEGHRASNVAYPDFVVHSLAIPAANPELKEARRKNIPILSYPQAVGKLTKLFRTIAVSGTHGKSTICAMLTKILIENEYDPTVIVGTTLGELDYKNFRLGKSKLLVLEACEYKRAFLNYSPQIIVLHTLDPDHLDYYKDFKDYIKAFREFADKLPRDGYFFGNLDDEDIHDTLQNIQAKKFPTYNTFTYGMQYAASDFYLRGNQIIAKNKVVGEFNLKIPGEHNRMNALAAFAVSSALGLAPKRILKSLNAYKGSSRRLEFKGRVCKRICCGRICKCIRAKNKATLVIDDYAHHPVEIRATLQAAREKFPNKKLCVVFQPHQYSRTKKLLTEFGKAFKDADTVIIPNIYEVRDNASDKKNISAEMLVNEIKKHHPAARNGEGFEKTIDFLRKNAAKFDVIITMGAGDVWKIGDALLK